MGARSVRKLLNQNSFVTLSILVIAVDLLWLQQEELTYERITIFSLILVLYYYMHLHLQRTGIPISSQSDLRELQALYGKPIIIEIYSNFSIACLFVTPMLDLLEKELADEIGVIRINVQTRNGTRMAENLCLDFVPTFIVLNKDGMEIWRKVGLASRRMLQAQIEPLL